MLAITPKGFVPGSGSCGPRYRAQCALADDQVRGDNELFPLRVPELIWSKSSFKEARPTWSKSWRTVVSAGLK